MAGRDSGRVRSRERGKYRVTIGEMGSLLAKLVQGRRILWINRTVSQPISYEDDYVAGERR